MATFEGRKRTSLGNDAVDIRLTDALNVLFVNLSISNHKYSLITLFNNFSVILLKIEVTANGPLNLLSELLRENFNF